MNTLLWLLQILTALLYGASGVMKLFMIDEISAEVPTFAALPRGAWMALGVLELVCVAGLLLPALFRRRAWANAVVVAAAAALALESLLFIWVHVQYRETGPIIMSAVLGAVMAFIAYGRMFLQPIG